MALKAGPKQVRATNLTIPLAAPTNIFVLDVILARAVLIELYGGNSANAITMTPSLSKDGSVAVTAGPAITALPSGTFAVNGSVDAPTLILLFLGATSSPPPVFVAQHLIIGLQAATGDVTGVKVNAWPLFEVEHPNIPLGISSLPA